MTALHEPSKIDPMPLSDSLLHSLSATPELLRVAQPAQLLYIEEAITYVPHRVMDHYPTEVVANAQRKIHTASRAIVMLSMRGNTIAGIFAPHYVDENAFLQTAPTPDSPNRAGPIVPEAAVERTGEYSLIEDDIEDPETDLLVRTALKAERVRQERQAVARRAQEVVERLQANMTDAEKSQQQQQTRREKLQSSLKAQVELAAAVSTGLSLGRRERAFVVEAVHRYDPIKLRRRLAKELRRAESGATAEVYKEPDDVDEVLGYTSLRGKVSVLAGRLVSRIEVGSAAGAQVIRALQFIRTLHNPLQ